MTRARASALLLGAASLAAFPVPARSQTGPVVRVAPIPTEGGQEANYAKDAGFFTGAGLNVDVQMMAGTSVVAAAVVSNAVDIGYGNIDVLAALRAKNVLTVCIAGANEYTPATSHGTALVLPATSQVKTAKDLTGKVAAVGVLGSVAETATKAWIDQNGGDSTTVKFVEIPIPAMGPALDSARIDVALVVDPYLATVTKTHRVLGYAYSAIAPRFLLGAWFTTPQWANEHPDLVKNFVTAIGKTATWANANPEPSGAILSKYTKIDPAVIAGMTRAHFLVDLRPASMQPLIDVAAKYNNFASMPAQQLIYTPRR